MLQSPEDRAKNELLQCYRRGWKHGACFNAYDKRFTEHQRQDIRSAYERGYANGRDASFLAGAAECERLGYDARTSILRSKVTP